MSHLVEALYDSVNVWRKACGRAPTELVLSQGVYLSLAADLGIDDPAAARRATFDRTTVNWGLPDARVNSLRGRDVRVGSSFVFHGFGEPLTIREAA